MDLTLADPMSVEFAICTNPRQEDRAYHNLLTSSVECFINYQGRLMIERQLVEKIG